MPIHSFSQPLSKMEMKEINVQDPWFSHMRSKRKTIEGRLNKGLFKSLTAGENIRIKNGVESFVVQVRKIRKYESFEQYLSMEGLRKSLPFVSTIKEGCDVYYKFYTKEQEKEFGVLAIRVRKID